MNKMHELKQMLWHEFDEISSKGGLSAGDLETVHKLTDTIKNIDKICALEDGYSQDGGWRAEGMYSRGYDHDYGMGNSYGRNHRYPMYSRGGGYLKDALKAMMKDEDLTSDEKMALKKAMDYLK